MRIRISVAAGLALAVASCFTSKPQYHPKADDLDRPPPGQPMPVQQPPPVSEPVQQPPHQQPSQPVARHGDFLQGPISEFCASLAAQSPKAVSMGCLPLVTYDLRKGDPSISVLGERIADEAALGLNALGYRALQTTAMGVEVSRTNVERTALFTLEAVVQHGDRLGLDVVVFGKIRRDDNVGRIARHVLSVDLFAYDFVNGAVVSRKQWEIPSDHPAAAEPFRWHKQRSLWEAGTAWRVPEETPSFDREIKILCESLAKQCFNRIDDKKIEGVIYIPPTDTALFVRSVARVRSAQAAFAAEYTRRLDDANATGKELDDDAPLVINEIEFPNLQQARAYLTELREGLMAGPAVRFGQAISSTLAETLRPLLEGNEVRVNDVGFTKWSDTQLIEGELALGGLARSLVARQAMKESGITLVIAPRIDRFGTNYVLRAEVYDLVEGQLAASAHQRLADKYADDLRAALDVEDLSRGALQKLPPVSDVKTSKAYDGDWSETVDQLDDGVCLLQSDRGHGTGFYVSDDGLIMTNWHVADGLGGTANAVNKDGTVQTARTVLSVEFWDVAVMKVDQTPKNAHIFEFAEPDDVRVGAEVATIGHPKRLSGWIFSPGHLSSMDEKVERDGNKFRDTYMYTCPTRQGNSGGPVFLRDGRVAAVNSHGLLGEVSVIDTSGRQVEEDADVIIRTELPGFALGAPGHEAKKILEQARARL